MNTDEDVPIVYHSTGDQEILEMFLLSLQNIKKVWWKK